MLWALQVQEVGAQAPFEVYVALPTATHELRHTAADDNNDHYRQIISITLTAVQGYAMAGFKTVEIVTSGVGTLAGTPTEIGEQLRASGAEHAIALTFAHGSKRMVRIIADTLGSLAPMMVTLVEQRQREALNKIVDALVPTVVPPEHLMKEARMAAQARNKVLASGDWLTAAQIAELAGFSASNLSAQPNKWKRDGQVFAIRHQNTDYFPAYGLDSKAGHRPLKHLAPVLAVFGAEKDGWGLAYWFASVNSFLGGKRPQDLLAMLPQRVLAAAVDEMTELGHG